jgi:hypothetical protein
MEKVNDFKQVAEDKVNEVKSHKDTIKKVLIGVGIGAAGIAAGYVINNIMHMDAGDLVDTASTIADAAAEVATDTVNAAV